MTSVVEKAKAIPSRRGASLELANMIRNEIFSGSYNPGDRLLTMQELTKATSLGYSTINRAVAMLVEEGILESRKGAGTFVKNITHIPNSAKDSERLEDFALVIPEVRSGFYCSLQQGFGDGAAKYHRQILVCNTGNILARQSDILMQLVDKRIAGIAIVPCSKEKMPAYQVRTLQHAGIPVVQLHRRTTGMSAPFISIPFEKIGATAAHLIASHKHQKVAILSSHHSESSTLYLKGFHQAIKELGVTMEAVFRHGRFPEDNWEKEMQEIIEKLLASQSSPTAVFTHFDNIAEMVYLAALQQGMKIPEDLQIVTFGSFYRNSAIDHQIIAVTVDETWGGQKAAELLQEITQGKRPRDDREEFTMPIYIFEETNSSPSRSRIAQVSFGEKVC